VISRDILYQYTFVNDVHLGTASVWLVGSSIIKIAFIETRSSEEGTNLGLGRINVSIWWRGQGGICILISC
jgi:hypothetical protein